MLSFAHPVDGAELLEREWRSLLDEERDGLETALKGDEEIRIVAAIAGG